MAKYKVTLEVIDTQEQYSDPVSLEVYLVDVIRPALDALGLELIYSTVGNKRG
jgi:hypothetical protein